MKFLSVLLCLGFVHSAVAETLDAQLDAASESPYAVELNMQTIGEFGGQAVQHGDSGLESVYGYRSTDGLISITARKSFTRDFDLSFSAPIFSLVSHDALDNRRYVRYDLHPFSLGARYQLSYFDLVKPSFQVDLGEAYVSQTIWREDDVSNSYVSDVRSFFRPFAKAAVGVDVAFSAASPMYAGFKAGYLFMKEFGALNTGVQLGYRF
jgi:hypothetical protein